MATKRLNALTCETIAKKALAHRFKKEALALCAEGAELAEMVYCQLYSEEDRKKMRALPEGWLPEDTCIRASFACEQAYIYQNGYGFGRAATEHGIIRPDDLPEMGGWRFKADGRRFGPLINFPPNDELTPIFSALSGKSEAMRVAISAADTRLRAALKSVTTIGALIKAWPELEPFVPGTERKANLPDITRSELNRLLDLPVT